MNKIPEQIYGHSNMVKVEIELPMWIVKKLKEERLSKGNISSFVENAILEFWQTLWDNSEGNH